MYKKLSFIISFVVVLGLAANTAVAELVAYYPLDEGSGTTAADASGNGHNGAIQGTPAWVSGLPGFGTALYYDGQNPAVGWVDCGRWNPSEVTGQLTVAFWCRWDGPVPGVWQGVVAKRDYWDDTGQGAGSMWEIEISEDTQEIHFFRGGSYPPGAFLPEGEWKHIAATFDGTTAIFYVDAVEANRGAFSFGPKTDSMITIGCDNEGGWNGFNGILDDVYIYDLPLSPSEIQDIMLGVGESEASNPSPPDNAVDVPVDANLSWERGKYAIQDEVYFGTDPCMANLPKIATLSSIQQPLVDLPADLIASATYYWYVVETDANLVRHEPDDSWRFTTVLGEARPFMPTDGAIILGDNYPPNPPHTHIYTPLDFTPGQTTVSFMGYFSDDYAEVANRDPAAYLGPPPYPTTMPHRFYVGLPIGSLPHQDSLKRGMVYYWAVDSNDAQNNEFPSDVWEFTILGYYASAPYPPNDATFIPQDVRLSWRKGAQVNEHDIYMGTNWEDVNNARYNELGSPQPPEFLATVTDTNYPVTGLPFGVKHYWRVDEVYGRYPPPVGGGTYYIGPVWNFTVIPEGVGTIREDLWWNMTGTLPELYADPDFPANPDETRILDSFDSGTNLGDDYGGMIHGWLQVSKSGDYRFWICTDDNSELWLSTDESPSNMQVIANESSWTNPLNWNNDESMSGLIPLSYGQKYYIRAVWEDGTGGDHCQVAWQGPDQPLAPVNGQDFAIIPGSRLMSFAQLWAHSPDPAQGQAGVASPVMLRWGPGDSAAKHDVYLSTDRSLVDARDASAFKGRIDPNNYGPIVLETARVYYWAIDEVNDLGPAPGIWYGSTWMFRAAGGAGGLQGLYYHWDDGTSRATDDPGPDNPFQIFVLSRIEPTVNFPRSGHYWATIDDSPDPNINVDKFACKWVGHVEAPMDANYTFYFNADDGVRLFIDDVKLPLVDSANPANDSWINQPPREYNASVVLSAGLHDIQIQYYEDGGGAAAQLRWSAIPTNPSDSAIPKQIIPSLWLWPPLFATGPNPPHLSTVDDRKPALEFLSGLYAVTHELYFSANYDDVNDRNPLVRQILIDPCRPHPVAAPPLELGRTYYWCVDEVKSVTERWDAKSVWEFTIAECISLDNFEDYNDRSELRQVWRDGNADVVWGGTYPFLYLIQGGSSGSNLNLSSAVGGYDAAGAPSTGPVPPTPLNYEAMVFRYDNDGWTYTGLPGEERWRYDAPYFSEIEANTVENLDVGSTWSAEGVKSVSMWFQGHPISDGSYDATFWPQYTITGRGRDIQGRHDEFYFLSQYPLTTPGTVQVQVLDMENTDPWAKAGVMIREKWTPYSKYAAVYVTPGNGVAFEWRENGDGPVQTINKTGITAPQYVKLERTVSGNFIAKHSSNGLVWQDVNDAGETPLQPLIVMGTEDPNLYIGTVVTSHDALATCTADFNNVLASPSPTNWIFGNIGTNDPEQLYIALSDGITTAVVNHPDPNAAALTDWQEWSIELTDFGGINLNNIRKVYVGLGDRAAPVQGGSGAIYVDDFRACPPRCVASYAKPQADIAVPYDCVVDEKDLAALAADYLMRDELIVTSAPTDVNKAAHYMFEGNYLDSSLHLNHLVDPCGTAPGFDTGMIGAQALALDGVEDHLVVNGVGISGTTPRTIACWAKSDSMVITDWTLIFGFTGNADASGGDGSHFNIGYTGSGITPLEPSFIAHVWGWEEQILPLDVGVWHHFAMTYDGTTVAYFADGIGLDTDPGKSNVRDLTHADRVHVGKRATSNLCFPGKVDDARIYSVVLSKEEIAYLGTNGAPSIHIPIPSDADLYQGEAPGSQWINLKDYGVLANQYLDDVLWP